MGSLRFSWTATLLVGFLAVLSGESIAGVTLKAPKSKKAALGKTLTIKVKASKGATVAVAPIPLPSGASFDMETGELRFIPDESQVGSTIAFTFTAMKGASTKSKKTKVKVTAKPEDGPTKLVGKVRSANSEKPLEKIVVRIPGAGIQTKTDAKGRFVLKDLPDDVSVVEIDGMAKGFAFVAEDIELLLEHPLHAGQANVVDRPIYIPLLGDAAGELIGGGGHLEVPGIGVSLDVSAGSAKQGGQIFSGVMFMPEVDKELTPAALPAALDPAMVVAIQPAGLTFSPPASITLPNVDGLPLGAVVDLWSINPDTGMFEDVGDGTVVSGGKLGTEIRTTSGGVNNSSWHFFLPPGVDPGEDLNANNNDNQDPDLDTPLCGGSSTSARTGALEVRHATVPYRSVDTDRSVELVYNSGFAAVKPVVSVTPTIPVQSTVPKLMSTRLDVSGLISTDEVFTDTSGLNEGLTEVLRQVATFDAAGLPTGLFPYVLTLTNHFAASSVSTSLGGSLLVRNEMNSPVGAGWTIDGVARLIPAAPDKLLLVDGDGTTQVFRESVAENGLTLETFDAWSFGEVLAGFAGAMPQPFIVTTAAGAEQVLSYILPTVNFPSTPTGKLLNLGPDGIPEPGSSATVPLGDDIGVLPSNPSAYGIACKGYLFVPEGGLVGFSVKLDNRAALYVDDQLVLSGDCSVCTKSGTMDLVAGFHKIALYHSDYGGAVTLQLAASGGGLPSEIIGPKYLFTAVPDDTGTSVVKTFAPPPGSFRTLRESEDGTVTLTEKGGVVRKFDAAGREVARVDRQHNETSYAYDGDGRLVEIVDPVGLVTRLEYKAGRLHSIVDPTGRKTQLSHDSGGDLTKIVDPDGTVRKFTYDGHRMVSQTDKRGNKRTYSYDIAGRHAGTAFPDGTSLEIKSAESYVLLAGDGLSATEDEPLPVVRPEEVVAEFRDPGGHETRFCVNRFGGATEIVDAIGRVTTLEYNLQGRVSAVTYPNGAAVTYVYDDAGNPTSITEHGDNGPGSDDRTHTFAYNELSQLTAYTNPENKVAASTGVSLELVYSGPGSDLATITDAAGTVTEFHYDDPSLNPTAVAGLLTSVTSAKGNAAERTTTFGYDPATGNRSSTADAMGRVARSLFDGAGRLTILVVEGDDGPGVNDQTLTYSYHPDTNYVATSADDLGQTTAFDYDKNGNLVEITDARLGKIRWSYDALNRPMSRSDPLNNAELYTYDAVGNPATFIDRKGTVFTFTYDAVNRVVRKSFADPTAPGGAGDVSFGYDGNNNGVLTDDVDDLALIQNPWVTVRNQFDAFGEIISTTTSAGSSEQAVPDVVTSYTYNKNGTRRDVTAGGGALASIAYGYDVLDRTESVTDALLGVSATLTYDAMSQRNTLTRATGGATFLTDYTFNPAGELEAVAHTLDPAGANTLLSSFAYTYDALGRRESLSAERPLIGFVLDRSTYSYDAANRLTAVTRELQDLVTNPITMPVDEQELYDYDAVGNRISDGVASPTWQYDAANRLLDDGTFAYAYDQNGNQTQKTSKSDPSEVTSYTWDAENRLVGAAQPDGTTTAYRYDGLGRRVSVTVGGTTPSSEATIYDGFNRLLVYRSSSPGTFTLEQRRTSGPAIDDLMVSEDVGNGVRVCLSDSLGSVTDILTAAGAPAGGRRYSAFGETKEYAWSGPVEAGFTGQEWDRDTELWHFRARYVDPRTGRFISEDPLGVGGSGVNAYAYVQNAPTALTDPHGTNPALAIAACLESPPCALAVASGIAAIGYAAQQAAQGLANAMSQIELPSFSDEATDAEQCDSNNGPKDPCKGLRQ